MKKIDKFDIFIFVCIVLACVFGLATMMSGWILDEQILWITLLTAIFWCLSSGVLMGCFASDILEKIINNHKVKKKIRREKNEKN